MTRVSNRRQLVDWALFLLLLSRCIAPACTRTRALPASPSADIPTAIAPIPTATTTPTVKISNECGFVYLARAWIDANENGVWDVSPREAGLAGVTFHITLGDQKFDAGSPSKSAQDGLTRLEIMWGGTRPCSVLQRELERERSIWIYPEVPAGYRLTSAPRQEAQDCDLSCTFGFVLDASASTPPAQP